MPGAELYSLYNLFRKQWGGFPGDSVAKNLPANGRDTGSVIPDLRRPYTSRSSSVRAPQLLSLCSATREATVMRSLCITKRSSPDSPQPEESSSCSIEDPALPKNNSGKTLEVLLQDQDKIGFRHFLINGLFCWSSPVGCRWPRCSLTCRCSSSSGPLCLRNSP